MKKSPDAFRTISEVAAWLETPAHVLRFWESRFPDLKPVQRAGGRRYYRRDDMLLLGGIKHLLHTEGHTIKSVQDRIAADGTAAIAAFSQPLGSTDAATTTDAAIAQELEDAEQDAAQAARRGRPAADAPVALQDEDAPPIGFFFDDSDDAAPAEAQSGTFAQALPVVPPDAPDAPDTGGAPAPPPAADDPPPMADPLANSPAPDLAPRLGALPRLPDDPADDAAGFGTPLPLPARLRALHHEDVPAAQRVVLTGLYRRLEGWSHATG